MWRMGFDSPENFDDDQTYCGSVQQETFYTHSCLILTAGVGASNGMKIVDVVESVEILGMTFPGNMRHLWVKPKTTLSIPNVHFIFIRKICYGNNRPEV